MVEASQAYNYKRNVFADPTICKVCNERLFYAAI